MRTELNAKLDNGVPPMVAIVRKAVRSRFSGTSRSGDDKIASCVRNALTAIQ